MKKVLVYVQHLLGIGHLHRTALITKSLAANEFDVTVVNGGVPEPMVDFGNISLVQLPAIKTDSTFSNLLDESGKVLSLEAKNFRKSILLKTYNRISPDFVLIETYPFGRRQMRFELLPLLQTIRAKTSKRPAVACSIRDVIQPKRRAKRISEIVDVINKYFDYIFVHGDKNIIRLDESFPDTSNFKNKIVYTGYIAKPRLTPNTIRSPGSILVSAGGGAVGQKLYQTAILASRHKQGQNYHWHILVGNNTPEPEYQKLKSLQSGNVDIERNRIDFLQLLGQCSVSVSQAGYNTIMDILLTQTPAIVVPFEGTSEEEQLIRATRFEKEKVLTMIRENDLSEPSLLHAISMIKNIHSAYPLEIGTDGARTTAEIIREYISCNSKI